MFSVATCRVNDATLKGECSLDHDLGLLLTEYLAAECVSDHGKAACANLGGECVTERDGYYIVSAVCLALGVLSVIFFMIPTARKLQGALCECWGWFNR